MKTTKLFGLVMWFGIFLAVLNLIPNIIKIALNPGWAAFSITDMASHTARVFFLGEGYFWYAPQWYMGFSQFNYYPPLSYVVPAVLYRAGVPLHIASTSGLMLANALFIAGFYRLFRLRLDPLTASFLVLMLLVNPASWLFFFIYITYASYFGFALSAWSLYYFFKDENKTKALLLGGLVCLTHLVPAVLLTSFLVLWFLINRPHKAYYAFMPFALASFWYVPFLAYQSQVSISGAGIQQYSALSYLMKYVGCVSVFALLFFLRKTEHRLMTLAYGLTYFFVATDLIAHIPVLRSIFTMHYVIFAFILVGLHFNHIGDFGRRCFIVLFTVMLVVKMGIGFYTGSISPTVVSGKTASNNLVLNQDSLWGAEIKPNDLGDGDRYFVFESPQTYSCYLLPRHSVSGWFPQGANQAVMSLLGGLGRDNLSCGEFTDYSDRLGLKYAVTASKTREDFLRECGWKDVKSFDEHVVLENPVEPRLVEGPAVGGVVWNPPEVMFDANTPGRYVVKLAYLPRFKATLDGEPTQVSDNKPGLAFDVRKAGLLKVTYPPSIFDYAGLTMSAITCLLMLRYRTHLRLN